MQNKPYTIHSGKLEDVLPSYPENTFDSCVTDPPYGIRFMGKAWDSFDIEKGSDQRNSYDLSEKRAASGRTSTGFGNSVEAGKYKTDLTAMRQFQSWTEQWASHVYRVLKPGAYLIVFASPRTYHRMVCGVEDAGFEIRDTIMWVFASGFPKSSNQSGDWKGWGSALKPAYEPILIARKPLSGTIPENLKEYGTGAINIDACRVDGAGPWLYGNQPKLNGARYQLGTLTPLERHAENVAGGDKGRWPANFIHDGSEEVVALFPESKGQQGDLAEHKKDRQSPNGCFGKFSPARDFAARNDSGSAARFFYCAKTSPLDRNEGLDHLKSKQGGVTGNDGKHITRKEIGVAPTKNNHPTVKPTELMRYLCKLVTRPGGKVLDPFAGSGSTGKAALFENMLPTLVDMDEQWAPVQAGRCEFAIKNRSTQMGIFDAF